MTYYKSWLDASMALSGHLDHAHNSLDAVIYLGHLRECTEFANNRMTEAVIECRSEGIPWSQIGVFLHISAEDAEKRYGHLGADLDAWQSQEGYR